MNYPIKCVFLHLTCWLKIPSSVGAKSQVWCHFHIHHFSLLFLWESISRVMPPSPLSIDPEVSLLVFFSLWWNGWWDKVFLYSFGWPQVYNLLVFLLQTAMTSKTFLPDESYRCAIKGQITGAKMQHWWVADHHLTQKKRMLLLERPSLPGRGMAHLSSQHLGGRRRSISMRSRTACSTG